MIEPDMHLLNLRSVLAATELDDPAFPAVRTASRLASAAGASLHLVVVTSPTAGDRSDADVRAELTNALEHAGDGPRNATIHVLAGDPALAIRSLADRIQADVIVLGPHRGPKSPGRSVGGTALAVVTNASCPCLIAAAALRLPLDRVLVPVDLSDTARGALLVGLSWAAALRTARQQNGDGREVTLTALHVARSGGSDSTPRAVERELEIVRAAGGTWAGVSIHGETIADTDVTHGIAAYASREAPDLVVMGTRGLGLDPVGRIGSVTASVTRAIDVPALLVPPAVWITHARPT